MKPETCRPTRATVLPVPPPGTQPRAHVPERQDLPGRQDRSHGVGKDSGLLKAPERLHVGVKRMVEEKRAALRGAPPANTSTGEPSLRRSDGCAATRGRRSRCAKRSSKTTRNDPTLTEA